jgi:hypothetical protein
VLTVATQSVNGSVGCYRGRFGRHRRPGLQFLLKTRTAENRSALCWFEWNRGFGAACRAGCTGFSPHAPAARTFRLALLTVFGIVLELLIVEEELLARGEHKFGAAVSTLQNPVDEFHGRLPQRRKGRSSAINMRARRSRFPVFDSPLKTKGPGPPNSRRRSTVSAPGVQVLRQD